VDTSVKYPLTRWLVLLAGGICIMAATMYLISFSAILPEISRSLDIDIGTATNFMSLFTLAAAVCVMAGGALCDRLGILPVLALSALLSSGGAVLMLWAGHYYPTAMLARIVEGIGTGFGFSLISPIMTIWFPPNERGRVAGLLGMFVALGAVVGFPVSSAIFKATRVWQQMSAWISIAGWVSFLLVLILIAMPKPKLPSQAQATEKVPTGNGFGSELKEPIFYICIAVSFFAAWQLQTIFNITPTYMSATIPLGLGFGYMTASKLMLGVSIAGVLAPIVSGIIQDRIFKTNARPFMFIGFALCSISMYLILLPSVYTKIPFLVVCLVFAGSGIAVISSAIPLFVGLNYPVHILGKAYGIIAGLGNFGGAIGLYLAGKAVEARGNYHLAVTIISLAALVGFILILLLKRWKIIPAPTQ
jgi:MFS family permease